MKGIYNNYYDFFKKLFFIRNELNRKTCHLYPHQIRRFWMSCNHCVLANRILIRIVPWLIYLSIFMVIGSFRKLREGRWTWLLKRSFAVWITGRLVDFKSALNCNSILRKWKQFYNLTQIENYFCVSIFDNPLSQFFYSKKVWRNRFFFKSRIPLKWDSSPQSSPVGKKNFKQLITSQQHPYSTRI